MVLGLSHFCVLFLGSGLWALVLLSQVLVYQVAGFIGLAVGSVEARGLNRGLQEITCILFYHLQLDSAIHFSSLWT